MVDAPGFGNKVTLCLFELRLGLSGTVFLGDLALFLLFDDLLSQRFGVAPVALDVALRVLQLRRRRAGQLAGRLHLEPEVLRVELQLLQAVAALVGHVLFRLQGLAGDGLGGAALLNVCARRGDGLLVVLHDLFPLVLLLHEHLRVHVWEGLVLRALPYRLAEAECVAQVVVDLRVPVVALDDGGGKDGCPVLVHRACAGVPDQVFPERPGSAQAADAVLVHLGGHLLSRPGFAGTLPVVDRPEDFGGAAFARGAGAGGLVHLVRRGALRGGNAVVVHGGLVVHVVVLHLSAHGHHGARVQVGALAVVRHVVGFRHDGLRLHGLGFVQVPFQVGLELEANPGYRVPAAKLVRFPAGAGEADFTERAHVRGQVFRQNPAVQRAFHDTHDAGAAWRAAVPAFDDRRHLLLLPALLGQHPLEPLAKDLVVGFLPHRLPHAGQAKLDQLRVLRLAFHGLPLLDELGQAGLGAGALDGGRGGLDRALQLGGQVADLPQVLPLALLLDGALEGLLGRLALDAKGGQKFQVLRGLLLSTVQAGHLRFDVRDLHPRVGQVLLDLEAVGLLPQEDGLWVCGGLGARGGDVGLHGVQGHGDQLVGQDFLVLRGLELRLHGLDLGVDGLDEPRGLGDVVEGGLPGPAGLGDDEDAVGQALDLVVDAGREVLAVLDHRNGGGGVRVRGDRDGEQGLVGPRAGSGLAEGLYLDVPRVGVEGPVEGDPQDATDALPGDLARHPGGPEGQVGHDDGAGDLLVAQGDELAEPGEDSVVLVVGLNGAGDSLIVHVDLAGDGGELWGGPKGLHVYPGPVGVDAALDVGGPRGAVRRASRASRLGGLAQDGQRFERRRDPLLGLLDVPGEGLLDRGAVYEGVGAVRESPGLVKGGQLGAQLGRHV